VILAERANLTLRQIGDIKRGTMDPPSLNPKLHHAAFDAHLIGIDPDYGIHVSDRLLEIRDGPFLELGLKGKGRTNGHIEADHLVGVVSDFL
jgi:hypothetical protein